MSPITERLSSGFLSAQQSQFLLWFASHRCRTSSSAGREENTHTMTLLNNVLSLRTPSQGLILGLRAWNHECMPSCYGFDFFFFDLRIFIYLNNETKQSGINMRGGGRAWDRDAAFKSYLRGKKKKKSYLRRYIWASSKLETESFEEE